jgi:hypothetical protein
MRKSNHELIREHMRLIPDGGTAADIAKHMGLDPAATKRALLKMPDAYIDRWVYIRGNHRAVWCTVTTPENCPKPERLK